jgi:hypothetical protein
LATKVFIDAVPGEKARILGDPAPSVKPLLRQKKAQLRGVALNPPKEEGGGDRRILPECLLQRNIIFLSWAWQNLPQRTNP